MALKIRKHYYNPLPALLALALGVLLVGVSIPGVVSAFFALTPLRLADRLDDDSKFAPPADDLAAASKRLLQATRLAPAHRLLRNKQSTLMLRRYYALQQQGETREAGQLLDAVRISLTDSLRLAPGDANQWYLLAELAALQHRLDTRTFGYLTMSYLTGPREGWIGLRRTTFALRYWLLLDAGLRDRARREIRTLWLDRSFRHILAHSFARETARAQKIIHAEVSGIGEAEAEALVKLARQSGWKGDAAALRP